jgi:hypothetical protein
VLQRISAPSPTVADPDGAASSEASTAEVRRWARSAGLPVPDRGRLRPEIWQAWNDAQNPG